MPLPSPPFPCAAYIREIGRGARGARGLSREQAHKLYGAILAGHVSDLELGAVLLAYRIKGESAEELAGMLEAVHGTMTRLECPSLTPVVIPSYNGARKRPNLVPLLALLLARRRIPVLIHGVLTDPDRVTTAQILAELGMQAATDAADIGPALQARYLAFSPTHVLAPALARQLSLRATLGVRNSAHTLAKLLQPFRQPALRLVNYTHPAYRDTLTEYFSQPCVAGPAGVLLSRGTEGEAAADSALPREALWLHDGGSEVLIAAADKDARDAPPLPESTNAASTAQWTAAVLAGEMPTPQAIAAQVDAIARIVERPLSSVPTD
jgi:anthranilate phosphoribosyltransferase